MKLEDFLKEPTITKRDKEIVLSVEQKVNSQVIEPEEQVDLEQQKFDEFMTVVDRALNAVTGIKKVIEQTQPKETVAATPKVQQAMKRMLGIESEVITFEIYQQALALREQLVFSQMRKAMVDEQIK
jgi:hypothetical protein